MGLPTELRRLLGVNAASFIVFIYLGIFVNLYIWEKSKLIFEVAWFNLFMFLVWPAAFALSARLLIRYSIRLLMGLSSLFGAFTFLVLTFVKSENHLLWITMVALPAGLMWGCFSAVNNLCVSRFGKNNDFAVFFSASNLISQVLNIAVPVISALAIQWWGFRGSFLFMLLFVLGMAAVTFTLPALSLRSSQSQELVDWSSFYHFKEIFAPAGMKWIIPSSVAGGVFMQFQALFAMLLTFKVSPDKITVAVLNTFYTVSALAALYFFRKLDWPGSRWMKVGIVLCAFGFAAMLLKNPLFLIASNLLTTVGYFYFTNMWTGGQFRCISRHDGMLQLRMLVWREALVCFSRTVMLLLILGVKEIQGGYFVLLLVLALASMVLGYLSDKKMSEHHLDDVNSSEI